MSTSRCPGLRTPPRAGHARSPILPVSGNAAIAAAEERAAVTGGRNIADVPPLPIPADTANVRSGPEVHPACLSLLPLIGVWRGTGLFGNDPDRKTPEFGQQITIAHDGRPFFTYESVSWLLGADGVGHRAGRPRGRLLAPAAGRVDRADGRALRGPDRAVLRPPAFGGQLGAVDRRRRAAPRPPRRWWAAPGCTASPPTAGWPTSRNARIPTPNWRRTPRRRWTASPAERTSPYGLSR